MKCENQMLFLGYFSKHEHFFRSFLKTHVRSSFFLFDWMFFPCKRKTITSKFNQNIWFFSVEFGLGIVLFTWILSANKFAKRGEKKVSNVCIDIAGRVSGFGSRAVHLELLKPILCLSLLRIRRVVVVCRNKAMFFPCFMHVVKKKVVKLNDNSAPNM